MTFAQEIEQVLSDITTVMGRTVTLRSVTPGSSIAAGAMTRSASTATQPLLVNETYRRTFDVAGQSSSRRIEERGYDVQASLVTLGTIQQGWEIDDTDGAAGGGSAVTLKIEQVDRDTDGRNISIVARRAV